LHPEIWCGHGPPSRVQKKQNKNKLKLGLFHFILYVHKNVHLGFRSKYSRNIPNSAWLASTSPHSSTLPPPWGAGRKTQLVPVTPPPPPRPSVQQQSLFALTYPYISCMCQGNILRPSIFRNAQVMHENALQKSKGQNKFQINNKNGFEKILQCL
jgi:hypothetical protein